MTRGFALSIFIKIVYFLTDTRYSINNYCKSLDFSVEMEAKDKKNIKIRLALTVNKILEQNKKRTANNKTQGTKDHTIVDSLRKLEASSGISFPIIQKISKAEKNAALSTIVAIAEGLDLSLTEFFSYFDKITDEAIRTENDKRKKKNK